MDGMASMEEVNFKMYMTYNQFMIKLFYLFKDFIMKNCIVCNSEFKPRARDKVCSIKCKILSSISKNENNCWLWNKSKANNRYGKLRWKSRWYAAHRASYEIFKGSIEKEKVIAHICDNASCVNPEHLSMMTQFENLIDCVKKQRLSEVQKIIRPRFTDDQISEIRLLKQSGFTYERLQRIFNCSITYLVKLVKNSVRKENRGFK